MADETTAMITSNDNALMGNYYLADGQPIDMPFLVDRIKKRFVDIDRLSAEAMLDLFFLHTNWKTFYNRKDSFRNFLKNDLNISKTHAYSIIRSVKCLSEYFQEKGKQTEELNDFSAEITGLIDDIGITKLISVSTLPRKENRVKMLDRLLGGEKIAGEELKPERFSAKRTSKAGLVIRCACEEDGDGKALALEVKLGDNSDEFLIGLKERVDKCIKEYCTEYGLRINQ